jgi:acetylornithine/N-succinyldiaminopimelate aminotransferase
MEATKTDPKITEAYRLEPDVIEAYRVDDKKHVGQTTPFVKSLVATHAQGSYIWDANGRRYLDFIAGLAVNAVGHANPEVRAAIAAQAEQMMHVTVFGKALIPVQVDLARRLVKHTPPGLDSIFFTNSGTEAIEGALKLARKFTRRPKFVSFEGAFHGRTFGSLSVSWREIYRAPFEPVLPGVTFVPFNDLKAAEAAIDEQTAAAIIEPIQGEGGVHVPSDDFLPGLAEICRRKGALLILDEIQTGFGRTGRFFACEHWGVVPDILAVAKALGGGMPLGGFISRLELMQNLTEPPLSHMTTFGGHPVSCAAGLASLKIIERDGLVARADRAGQRIMARLREIGEKSRLVVDVRGKGLMIGLELIDPETTKAFVDRAFELGLIMSWSIYAGATVRVAPPLNISDAEIDEGLAIIEQALAETAAR